MKLTWTCLFMLVLCCCEISCKAQKSTIRVDFKDAQKANYELILSGYSFAGYKYSETSFPTVDHTLFNVQNFGAVSNDVVLDKFSKINVISAASKNGKDVVCFPVGRNMVNPNNEELDSKTVSSSHIVFRGEINDFGEAVLNFEEDLPAVAPKKMWTCHYAIRKVVSQENTFLTEIIVDATREMHEVKVASIGNTKAGYKVDVKCLCQLIFKV